MRKRKDSSTSSTLEETMEEIPEFHQDDLLGNDSNFLAIDPLTATTTTTTTTISEDFELEQQLQEAQDFLRHNNEDTYINDIPQQEAPQQVCTQQVTLPQGSPQQVPPQEENPQRKRVRSHQYPNSLQS
jgi:hypothetical protein